MPIMPDWLSVLFSQHALMAFFIFSLVYSFCLPICEEIALILIGILAKLNGIDYWWAALACYPGFVISDFLYYSIARFFGTRLLRSRIIRRMVKPDKILASEIYFSRHGSKIVFWCRFLVGVRAPALIASGMFRMPFLSFSLYDSLSAVVSLFTWMSMGFFWGAALSSDMGALSMTLSILAPVCIAIAIFFVLRHISAEQKQILKDLDRKEMDTGMKGEVLGLEKDGKTEAIVEEILSKH